MTLRQTEELLKRCLELTEQRGVTSAKEWLNSREIEQMRWNNAHPDKQISCEDQLVILLEAYASSRLAAEQERDMNLRGLIVAEVCAAGNAISVFGEKVSVRNSRAETAEARLAEVTAQRKLSDWTEIEGDDDEMGAKLGKFLVWLCNLTEDGPRYLERATYLLITHRNAWAETELEQLTSDKKVLQALIEDYQKAVDGSGQHHLIAPENVKARFDELSATVARLTGERDAALLREETAQHGWKQSLDLLDKIAETLRRLPSVTGLSQVEKHEDILLAIGDLQACYVDASRARNGLYTKLQAENKNLTEALSQAQQALRDINKLTADYYQGGPTALAVLSKIRDTAEAALPSDTQGAAK